MRKILVTLVTGLALTFTACSGDSDAEPVEQVTVTEEATLPQAPTEPVPSPETQAPLPPTTAPEPPAPPTNDVDAVFLQVLKENTNSWDTLPDANTIELAHLLCDAWASGATFEEIGQVLLDSGYSVNDAGFFIGAATQSYCPKYSKNFQ